MRALRVAILAVVAVLAIGLAGPSGTSCRLSAQGKCGNFRMDRKPTLTEDAAASEAIVFGYLHNPRPEAARFVADWRRRDPECVENTAALLKLEAEELKALSR